MTSNRRVWPIDLRTEYRALLVRILSDYAVALDYACDIPGEPESCCEVMIDLDGDQARRLALKLIEVAYELDRRASQSGSREPVRLGELLESGEQLELPFPDPPWQR